MKNRITLIILLVAGFTFAQASKTITLKQNATVMKFAETITEDDLKDDLTILASDALEGRETGKRGQKMAAAFISYHYQEIGLEPPVSVGNSKSYYQKVKLKSSKPGDIYLIVNGEKFKNIEDGILYYGSEKKTGKILTEVVFAGSGSEKDFENLDVKGKSVLIINAERVGQRKANKIAKKKGATFIFVVRSNSDDEYKVFMEKYSHYFDQSRISLDVKKNNNENESLGFLFVSPTIAGKIMNQSFDKLTKSISDFNSGKKNALKKIKSKEVSYNLDFETKKITSENVLGYLEGTDLKDELIVITSHYDHEGIKNGKIYNGADDDGSGTVAVMEIAEAFAKAKAEGNGPRRSILFMNVTGEEKGLLGSSYYVSNPIFPLKNTVVDLNIDMIGRTGDRDIETTNYVFLIGADKLSSELHDISENMNNIYTKMYLDYTFNDEDHPARFYYRSDHWNFAKNGIPIIFYFNGVHEDYHQASDTVDKIEFEMLKKRAQLVFYTAWEIANRDGRLIVDKKPEENK
jgi:peptidase M28-like protein